MCVVSDRNAGEDKWEWVPLMAPKEFFSLAVVIRRHSSGRWYVYIVKQPLLRKSTHVCSCTQTFLGRFCSITACSFKFYLDLSVGKQWSQTKGQWSYIQTLALAHQLPGMLINPSSILFSRKLLTVLKILSAVFCGTWAVWMRICLTFDTVQNINWTDGNLFYTLLVCFLRACVFLVSMRLIIEFICWETR